MKSAHDTIKRFMIAFNRIDALYLKAIKNWGTKGNFFVLFYVIATLPLVRVLGYSINLLTMLGRVLVIGLLPQTTVGENTQKVFFIPGGSDMFNT